jgi:hypothetical protein
VERISFSRQANNFSSRIRGSRTSRNAVSPVSPREASYSTDRGIGVWKPARSARSAARKLPYLLSRLRGAPSIAGNASSSVEPQDLRLDLIAVTRLFIFPERDCVWRAARWGRRYTHEGGVYRHPAVFVFAATPAGASFPATLSLWRHGSSEFHVACWRHTLVFA